MSEVPEQASPRRWGWLVVAAMFVVGVVLIVLTVQADLAEARPWWSAVLMPLSTVALVGVVVWAIRRRSQGDSRRRLWFWAAAVTAVGLVLLAISLALVFG